MSALGAWLVLASSPAFAAEDTDICAFQGLAGSLNPPIPAINHDPGLENTTESGTYHFAGSGTCVKTDQAEPTNSNVYPVDITSDGSYSNKVCGTGTVDGGDGTSAPAAITSLGPGFEGPVEVSYHISFNASVGLMSTSNVTIQGDQKGVRSGGIGSGLVQILPTRGGDCVFIDVAFFQVTGAFALTV